MDESAAARWPVLRKCSNNRQYSEPNLCCWQSNIHVNRFPQHINVGEFCLSHNCIWSEVWCIATFSAVVGIKSDDNAMMLYWVLCYRYTRMMKRTSFNVFWHWHLTSILTACMYPVAKRKYGKKCLLWFSCTFAWGTFKQRYDKSIVEPGHCFSLSLWHDTPKSNCFPCKAVALLQHL